MRLGKLSVGMLSFAGVAMVFSGCLVIKGQPEAKQISKDEVRVKIKICGSSESNPDDCPVGNKGFGGEELGFGTALVGLRVPKGGVKVPKTIKAGQTDLVLTKDADFKRELNQFAPKGNKYKWFGYSGAAEVGPDTPDARVKFILELSKRFDKKKLKYRPTVGFRQENAPEDCGGDPFVQHGVGMDGTLRICINSPSESETRKHLKVKLKNRD
jgi:hypothetical protein